MDEIIMPELIPEKLKNDHLAMSIHFLVKVMSTDYAATFNKNFSTEGDKTFLKRRLYRALKDHDPKTILESYTIICEQKPEFMPSVGQIIAESKKQDKRRKSEEETKSRIEKYATLPNPKIQCVPIEILTKAKLQTDKIIRTKAEWMHDKELAWLSLQNKVASISKKYADYKHECGYGGCGRAGSMSHSTNGSEYWYCSKHFRMS